MPEFHRKELASFAKGKTDYICITDALVHLPTDMEKSFMTWKKEAQVRMYSIIIDEEPGDLLRISDVVHRVKALTAESEAVEDILSI